jgi:hypothetical protein
MPELEPRLAARLEQAGNDSLGRALLAAPLPDLSGHPPIDTQFRDWVASHRDTLGFGCPARAVGAAEACRAGLLLLAGDLEASHAISQRLESPDGAFWHGIMHRQEGDFANAKYWFRRVGRHPVVERLAKELVTPAPPPLPQALVDPLLRNGQYWPAGLVDLCEHVARADQPDRLRDEQCRSLVWREWQSLFVHCLDLAWTSPPNDIE